MRGFRAVLRKEAIQMTRDRATLIFALLIPVFELALFGLIDTNVKHVPTIVLDHSRTAESRELITGFTNTAFFDVVARASSRDQLHRAIVAGRAQVAIEIPPDYARRRLAAQPAHVLVLIDGSDSSVSSAALAAANGVALARSLGELMARAGADELPLNVHPLLLFNPDSRSANLLIPGLIAILLTFSGTILAAFAIVRERERGTLEQLMVTPVSAMAVVVGKLVPYLVLAFVELLIVLILMVTVFRVPIVGSTLLLLGLSIIYIFALLAVGILVSSRAKTQADAMQKAMAIMLPSVLLSGYVFPLPSLPAPLRALSQLLPATHFIAISRGIVLRDAGLADLWQHVAALLGLATVLILGSSRAFKKTIS